MTEEPKQAQPAEPVVEKCELTPEQLRNMTHREFEEAYLGYDTRAKPAEPPAVREREAYQQEAEWIRAKLGLPKDAPLGEVMGEMHVVTHGNAAYRRFIASRADVAVLVAEELSAAFREVEVAQAALSKAASAFEGDEGSYYREAMRAVLRERTEGRG